MELFLESIQRRMTGSRMHCPLQTGVTPVRQGTDGSVPLTLSLSLSLAHCVREDGKVTAGTALVRKTRNAGPGDVHCMQVDTRVRKQARMAVFPSRRLRVSCGLAENFTGTTYVWAKGP